MLRHAVSKLAHNSTLPSLGNKDLKPLQDLITAEKTVFASLQKLSGDLTKASEALKTWGMNEGDELSDILSASSELVNIFSRALGQYSSYQHAMREHMKAVRDREEALEDLRRRSKTLLAKGDTNDRKLEKLGPGDKTFAAQKDLSNRIREQIDRMETEIMTEEAALRDYKRRKARAWMEIKFGGLMECCEKGSVSCEFGKMIINEIPEDVTSPGVPRPAYTNHERISSMLKDATKCVDEVAFSSFSLESKDFLSRSRASSVSSAYDSPSQDSHSRNSSWSSFASDTQSDESSSPHSSGYNSSRSSNFPLDIPTMPHSANDSEPSLISTQSQPQLVLAETTPVRPSHSISSSISSNASGSNIRGGGRFAAFPVKRRQPTGTDRSVAESVYVQGSQQLDTSILARRSSAIYTGPDQSEDAPNALPGDSAKEATVRPTPDVDADPQSDADRRDTDPQNNFDEPSVVSFKKFRYPNSISNSASSSSTPPVVLDDHPVLDTVGDEPTSSLSSSIAAALASPKPHVVEQEIVMAAEHPPDENMDAPATPRAFLPSPRFSTHFTTKAYFALLNQEVPPPLPAIVTSTGGPNVPTDRTDESNDEPKTPRASVTAEPDAPARVRFASNPVEMHRQDVVSADTSTSIDAPEATSTHSHSQPPEDDVKVVEVSDLHGQLKTAVEEAPPSITADITQSKEEALHDLSPMPEIGITSTSVSVALAEPSELSLETSPSDSRQLHARTPSPVKPSLPFASTPEQSASATQQTLFAGIGRSASIAKKTLPSSPYPKRRAAGSPSVSRSSSANATLASASDHPSSASLQASSLRPSISRSSSANDTTGPAAAGRPSGAPQTAIRSTPIHRVPPPAV